MEVFKRETITWLRPCLPAGRFHRQKPIDEFIVDFFCPDLMLAIEIDDGSHIGKEKYDAARQKKLEKLGIRFLRFKDDDVFYNCDWVMKEIVKWIEVNGAGKKK